MTRLRLVVPEPAQAWCYTCKAMTKYRLPLPPLKYPHPAVTMREGICDTCGGVLWRVGGARLAEGLKAKAKDPVTEEPDDLLYPDHDEEVPP